MSAIEDLAPIRKALKQAGLTPAKKDVSTNLRGQYGMSGSYSTITSAGFALKKETEYSRKKHVPTGRVVVTWLESSWKPNAEEADKALRTARVALEGAGFDTFRSHVPNTIYVAARS